MKKNLIILSVLGVLMLSCNPKKVPESSNDENTINAITSNPRISAIIDSCANYVHHDTIMTFLRFNFISDIQIMLYVGYSSQLPFVSSDFKKFCIQQDNPLADQLLTKDSLLGYSVSVIGNKTNYIFVYHNDVFPIPCSILNTDQLLHIDSIPLNLSSLEKSGKGYGHGKKILLQRMESIFDVSGGEGAIWMITPMGSDVVFD